MTKVRSFDDVSGVFIAYATHVLSSRDFVGILVADAGCILQSLSDYLAPHDHIVPLDLGAKGTCVESLFAWNVHSAPLKLSNWR